MAALLIAAPALTPDAAMGWGVGRAFGLLAGRARLMARARRRAEEDGGGGGGGGGGGPQTWTDARGHRHTKITSMAGLMALMPRRGQ